MNTEPHTHQDPARFADLRNGGNLSPRKKPVPRSMPPGWWILPSAVLGGMMLAAALAAADPIGRTVDAIVNPHIEGF